MLKEKIMLEALALAAKIGIAATTRDGIAARVPCSGGSVSFHYGEMRKLQRAIVVEAVRTSNYAVIGAAIAERHPSAANIEGAERAKALRAWIGK